MKIRVNPWPNLIGAFGTGAIVVAFCLALLWHDPLLFWNDDYELSILPVFADVARSWSEGHLPILSPYSWACSNLAGEFQYGTFSIFVNAAVIGIWKFPLAFPQQAAALAIVHLFVLAAGGYLLARDRKLSAPLATMVGLVTALNGWIICWGATDWFGALGAFAWLPWAWWGLERALDRQRGRWRFLWPAPFVYLVVTGGFPYTVLMLGLLIAWLAVRSFVQTKRLALLVPLLLGAILGFGLSAPAWMALFDYVRGSAREVQESAAHWQWRVPVAALPGFILPSWTVNWADFSTRLMPHTATEMACGLVPPVALFAAFMTAGRIFVRRVGWELGLLLVALIISMLPSANVFRWSFRWLPFVHLVLVLCAAEALQLLRDVKFGKGWRGLVSNPGAIAFVLVAVATAVMFAAHVEGRYGWPFTGIVLGLAAVWMALESFLRGNKVRDWVPPFVSAAVLLVTYLCIPPNCGVPKYNLSRKLTQPSPLDPQRLYLSIYPQPENFYRVEKTPGPFGEVVRPGSTSMWAGIYFINGYSPIRPAGIARRYDFGIHGEIDFAVAKWLLASEAGANGEMARLGIDGLIISPVMDLAPPPGGDWQIAYSSSEGIVYHRPGGPLPRVRSVSFIDSRPDERFAVAAVSRIVNGRNRVLADVSVPENGKSALLTISRPFFDGYRAKVGSTPVKVGSHQGLMPTIEIPAGLSGRLSVVYRPWWLIYGGAIAVLSLLVVLASALAAVAMPGWGVREHGPQARGYN